MARRAESGVAPLVLVHGDDEFAVKQRARQWYSQWCQELGGMDHETIDGQANNSGEALRVLGRLRESLQTLPFFGSAKAIWLQDCTFLGDERAASAAAVTEALAELAEELKAFPFDNVRLLISAGKVDKRKLFYKTVEKRGKVESFAGWSIDDRDWPEAAEPWVREAFQERGKRVSAEALTRLLVSVGPNTRQLVSEVEKVCLYVGGGAEVGLEDVEAVVARQKQARAFALADALGERNLPRLLRTLDEELWETRVGSRKTEIGLLYGLIAKVRVMLLLKEMMREQWLAPCTDYARFQAQLRRVPADAFPEDKRFNPLAMNPYLLFKAMPHAGRYTEQELIGAMALLLECNQRLVGSQLEEALVLQQTLIEIVRGSGDEPSGAGG